MEKTNIESILILLSEEWKQHSRFCISDEYTITEKLIEKKDLKNPTYFVALNDAIDELHYKFISDNDFFFNECHHVWNKPKSYLYRFVYLTFFKKSKEAANICAFETQMDLAMERKRMTKERFIEECLTVNSFNKSSEVKGIFLSPDTSLFVLNADNFITHKTFVIKEVVMKSVLLEADCLSSGSTMEYKLKYTTSSHPEPFCFIYDNDNLGEIKTGQYGERLFTSKKEADAAVKQILKSTNTFYD